MFTSFTDDFVLRLAQTVAQYQGGVRIKVTSHEHLKILIRELDIDPSPIIELVGKERVIQAIREELIKDIGIPKVIEMVGGFSKVIEIFGRENILVTIFPNLTKEQIKKLIEQNGNK
jgi:hypothetical protein